MIDSQINPRFPNRQLPQNNTRQIVGFLVLALAIAIDCLNSRLNYIYGWLNFLKPYMNFNMPLIAGCMVFVIIMIILIVRERKKLRYEFIRQNAVTRVSVDEHYREREENAKIAMQQLMNSDEYQQYLLKKQTAQFLNINEDNDNLDEYEADDDLSDESDPRFRDRVSDWQGEDISVSQQELMQVKNNADIRDYFIKDRQSQVVSSQEQQGGLSKNPRLMASKESLKEFMNLPSNDEHAQVRSGSRNNLNSFERGVQGRESLPSQLNSNPILSGQSQRHTAPLTATPIDTQQPLFGTDTRFIRGFSYNNNSHTPYFPQNQDQTGSTPTQDLRTFQRVTSNPAQEDYFAYSRNTAKTWNKGQEGNQPSSHGYY